MSDITPILCIHHSSFNKFHGFVSHSDEHNIGKYLTQHPKEPNLAHFMPRWAAENCPDNLQVIPYILFVCGSDIFVYSRNKKGGEARLHEKLSVGVGGHIEADDHAEEPIMAYLHGALREIQEEVGLEIPIQALQGTVQGLLHDSETPVGRVHLGVLHILHISPEQAATVLEKAEDTMTRPRFTPIRELHDWMFGEGLDGNQMEPWSRWALCHLVTLISKPTPWETPAVLERLRMLNLIACEVARSSAELLMQTSGRHWLVARENLETALGGLTTVLTSCCTNQDLDNGSIAHKGREFYEQAKQTMKHQDFQVAATQDSQP